MAGILAGKVAAITGGSSGFGAASAKLFVAEGAEVVLGDIQDERGAQFAESLGGGAQFVHCDVTSEDDVAGLVDRAVAEFGRLDVMYNNAGIGGALGPIDTTPLAEWSATLDVLLNGTFFGMKHAARVMKPAGGGTIISTSSIAGVTGGIGPHAYTAAKSAVIGLTKNVASELCRFGIRVNAIAPGTMATSMAAAMLVGDPNDIDGLKAVLAKDSPLAGRAGLAEDIARAALWLSSDAAGYVNGHVLVVDAGVTTGSTAGPGPYDEYVGLFDEWAPMAREHGRTGL
jgi:NAD(P)-dependent dehydrogenase (short-subunit alcohol dehydrogenase family)